MTPSSRDTHFPKVNSSKIAQIFNGRFRKSIIAQNFATHAIIFLSHKYYVQTHHHPNLQGNSYATKYLSYLLLQDVLFINLAQKYMTFVLTFGKLPM